MRGDGLETRVRRALALHARPLRARADLGRRARTRSSPSATARRSSSASATASSSSPPTSRRSSATRATSCSSTTRRWPSSRAAGVAFTDFVGARRRARRRSASLWDPVMAEKAGYKHFMLKEIFEQPRAVRETVLGRVSLETGQRVPRGDAARRRRRSRRSSASLILACGTSWHAALVGKFLIEELARVPVEVDYGSEFRYRDPIVDAAHAGGRHHPVGRDGRHARRRCARPSAQGARSIAICNVVGSMATREADGTSTRTPGPEIGVASTKAFTSQLVALHLLALRLGQARGTLSPERVAAAHRRAAAAAAAARADAARSTPEIEEIAGAVPHAHATSSTSGAASTTRSRSRARSS